jgi:hypothetical protein
MNCLRKAFCLCLICLTQRLCAAPPEGYVIQWGWGGAYTTAMSTNLICSNAVAISAGMFHSLALLSDRTVYGWGGEYDGQVIGTKLANSIVTNGIVRIHGDVLSNVVSIAASRYFSLGLKKDGTVVTWGENTVPAGLSNIVGIAVDDAHSWVLKSDGTVAGWYSPSDGDRRLFNVNGLSNIVAIAAGPQSTRGAGLRRDGTVGIWEGARVDQSHREFVEPPTGLSNVIAVAAGVGHSLALKKDGTLVAWGGNKFGQATGVPTTNSTDGVDFIGSGQVRLRGEVLSNVVSIAVNDDYNLALKRDGTIEAWGNFGYKIHPAFVPAGLSDVVAIAAGDYFCLAITTNKAVAEKFRK